MQKLNILIVGAGVAGLTCAGLLKKQGAEIKVIECESHESFNSSGYMLGLLPLGGRVLTQLDLHDEYINRSVEMKQYEIHKENGELIKSYSLDFINKGYGTYRGIERKELINILLGKIPEESIRYSTTLSRSEQKDNMVEVTLSDGSRENYDLVIIADGLHSQTRKLILDNSEYSYYDTNWGGWVAWLEKNELNSYKEYWGSGSFTGLYPVKDRVGVFLGGPDKQIKEMGLQQFIKEIKHEIHPDYTILHDALDKLLEAKDPYYWEFHDCKTERWNKRNVILLGDAACGFLPTAGVGASMAMDSAAALVDELSRTDRDHIEYGLSLYIHRQKERVEKAQKDSRDLAKIMFVKSKIVAGIRDYAIRFYSLKQLAANISKTMEGG